MELEIAEARLRADLAHGRYGSFASTHEALGVMVEEWDELRAAVQSNRLGSVREECLDLAAVCLRLAYSCEHDGRLKARSVK